jgi:hypothetical protein
MTVDDCIDQYLQLMDRVFSGCTWWNYAWDGQFYDAGELETVIKELIVAKLGPGTADAPLFQGTADAPLFQGTADAPLFQGNKECKTCVRPLPPSPFHH